MSKKIMLIGAGPHAKRFYIPWLLANKERAELSAVVELKACRPQVQAYFKELGCEPESLFIDQKEQYELSSKTIKELHRLVAKLHIDAVIVASEPASHLTYAMWALESQLHVLMDKPITARHHASNSLTAAKNLLADYCRIDKKYKQILKKKQNLLFSISAQRRFDSKFNLVMELVKEVSDHTSCPVTSIQSSCADGQWRMPDEIVDIDYHGFKQGYGKALHSGYHIFDLLAQFISKGIPASKQPDAIEVSSKTTKPKDYFSQLDEDFYQKLFGVSFSKRSHHERLKQTRDYGEIDSFSQFSFMQGEATICTAQVSLLHNSYSQRSHVDPNPDLYKGNGRIKHEYHCIQQGPLQSIQVHSYQSFKPQINPDSFGVAGTRHFDIHVFRNADLLGGEPYKRITAEEFVNDNADPLSCLLEGKETILEEFIGFITAPFPRDQLHSDLSDHMNSVVLSSAAYQAAIKNRVERFPYNS